MNALDDSFEQDPVERALELNVDQLRALEHSLHGSYPEHDDAAYARSNRDLLELLSDDLLAYVSRASRDQMPFPEVVHRLSQFLTAAAQRPPHSNAKASVQPNWPGQSLIALARDLQGFVAVDVEAAVAPNGWSLAEGAIHLREGKPIGQLTYRRAGDGVPLRVLTWWETASAQVGARAERSNRHGAITATERHRLERDARFRAGILWAAYAEVGERVIDDKTGRRAVARLAGLAGLDGPRSGDGEPREAPR